MRHRSSYEIGPAELRGMLADRLNIEIPADTRIWLDVDGGCTKEEVTKSNPLQFEIEVVL